MIEKVTFVVIGKNEAINLPRCFSSILKISDNIIFVDSDSDDNSVSIAKEYNVKKVFRVKANHGTPALSRSIVSRLSRLTAVANLTIATGESLPSVRRRIWR